MDSHEDLRSELARFDGWLAKHPLQLSALKKGATDAVLAKGDKAFGVAIPSSLRALWAWHEGEVAHADLFEGLLRESISTLRQAYSSAPIGIRFMPVAEASAIAPLEVTVGEEGECERTPGGDHLIPFVRVRTVETGAADDDDDEDDELADDDWLVAVDTKRQAVWLYEVGNQGLEGVFEEATSLAEWVSLFVEGLIAVPLPTANKPDETGRQPSVAPPAEVMLRMLVDKELVELAPDATLEDVAQRLAPILDLKPPKRAAVALTEFFESDQGIAELFADDEILSVLAREFAG